jgi:hypothetical protein
VADCVRVAGLLVNGSVVAVVGDELALQVGCACVAYRCTTQTQVYASNSDGAYALLDATYDSTNYGIAFTIGM